jgi:hypothetical protein
MHPSVGLYHTVDYYSALFDKAINNVRDSMSEKAFRLYCKTLVEELHCGHTEVMGSKAYNKDINMDIIRDIQTHKSANVPREKYTKYNNQFDIADVFAQSPPLYCDRHICNRHPVCYTGYTPKNKNDISNIIVGTSMHIYRLYNLYMYIFH